jgi:ABC-type nitrate/sulfonate/bicarbonate transport system ATPase subunit
MKIEVDSLSFGYDHTRKVLDDISFTVGDGQVLGVLGSSGCGKSTLLRILCGTTPKLSESMVKGKISFEGIDLDTLRSEGRIGLMFQEPSLLPNLTVEENVRFPLEIIGERFPPEVVDELIQVVGLEEFRYYLPKHLSGGMQTRTALARTFVTKPDLLLLDEPFTALDYGWKMDLYQKLTKMIAAFHSTVILVSHDIREVLLLANTVLLLSNRGKIAKQFEITCFKPNSYDPELLATYFDIVKPETVFLQNYFLEEDNLLG